MKIAVSGAHRTGKSTLVEELSLALPDHGLAEEPYYALEAEGHVFETPPSIEDFQLQLQRSMDSVREEGRWLFDRCPTDFLAYLAAHEDAAQFDLDDWLDAVQEAMAELDLVVYVPVEEPERIHLATLDYPELRKRMDEELREILVPDRWDLGPKVLEVRGTLQDRVKQVLLQLRSRD